MNDKPYIVEDLISDPGFRNWVLHPDTLSNRYWQFIMDENPECRDTILEAHTLVLKLAKQENSFTSEDESILWERIQSTVKDIEEGSKIIDINRKKAYPSSLGYKSNKSGFSRYWVYVAAVFAGVLVSAIVALQEYTVFEEPEEELVQQLEKEVPKGQKLKMHLPDGSKVALNASSRIIYPEHFTDEKRIVEIEGEVFFNVKKDSAHPFIVKCQGLETEVLGTSFNVNAYDNSGSVIVSLLEGSVKVNVPNNEALLLEPGEEMILNKESGSVIKRKIDHLSELKWMDGILAFNNESISNVFEKLEQWYGVDFIVDEIPRDKVLTGKFENEYLDNVLQSINYTVKFDFQISGDTVYVNFK